MCLFITSRYVPTVDDVEMYKSHKGPVTDLHIVDQYMMEVEFQRCCSATMSYHLFLRNGVVVSSSDPQATLKKVFNNLPFSPIPQHKENMFTFTVLLKSTERMSRVWLFFAEVATLSDGRGLCHSFSYLQASV